MNAREIAEKLYEMAMDMDWLDYEDTRETVISEIAGDIEKSGESLLWVLERIVPED